AWRRADLGQPARFWHDRDDNLAVKSHLREPGTGREIAEGLDGRQGRLKHRRTPADAQNCTRWVSAPSMMRLVPVIKLARGLARKTTALATSCGVPIRPVG